MTRTFVSPPTPTLGAYWAMVCLNVMGVVGNI